jgi:outer membrane protein assembly factor BamB
MGYRVVMLVVALMMVTTAVGAVPIPPGGTFTDDDGNFHEANIEAIAYAEITLGCETGLYCPAEGVTRGQMASFLVRAFDLTPTAMDFFTDDAGSSHEANINALRAAGVTLGCDAAGTEFCPADIVNRGQMASFLARALALEDGAGDDLFTDDDGSTHEANIDRLGTAGITSGCTADNRNFCPEDPVRRDQMASFLARALGLDPLVEPTPALGWSWSTSDNVHATPAIGAGLVIGATSDGMVAFERGTGIEVWANNIAVDFSAPTIDGGLVFVGSEDGSVYAVNRDDGTTSWSYDTFSLVNSSPVVVDDVVYVGSSSGSLYALDRDTGAENWAFAGGVFFGSPAVADGVVYAGSQNANVYAVDAATGTEIWSFTTGGLIQSSPAVVDGIVYIGSFDNKLYAIDAATGAEVWSATLGGPVRSSPAVADGVVVVGANDSTIRAFDAATGEPTWTFTAGDWVEASPVIDLGAVFIPSNDGNLYVLSLADGSELWRQALGGPARSGVELVNRFIAVGTAGDGDTLITISY